MAKIWKEKVYLMLTEETCHYLPFKQIVEKALRDIDLEVKLIAKMQQPFLEYMPLYNQIIELIAEYLQPDMEQLRQTIKTHSSFFKPFANIPIAPESPDPLQIRTCLKT
ncbi:MAG TPA: hypothetical protein VHE99_01600 [Gammaproteobacteria bacterium]|nr:hypothetical protein [Gammaproteobacteria bacterium]